MESIFNCNECNKSYKSRKSLKKHQRADHDANAQQYECLNCKKAFKLKHHLKSHEKNCEKGSAQCSLCPCVGSVYVIYEHYRKEHGINLDFGYIELQNETEFLAWKKKLEDEDFCSFVTWRSKYTKKDGTTRCFFRCNRAGAPRKKDMQPMRNTRGTTKIGGHCPAHLDVRISDTKCQIKFCRTHVGHELDVNGSNNSEKAHLKTSAKSTGRPTIELANSEHRELESINHPNRNGGIIHFVSGIEGHEEMLSDDFINFINDGKSLSHKKTLLKEQFIALIDEAEEGVQLNLISKTLKSLSDTIGILKMKCPPPLLPISNLQ